MGARLFDLKKEGCSTCERVSDKRGLHVTSQQFIFLRDEEIINATFEMSLMPRIVNKQHDPMYGYVRSSWALLIEQVLEKRALSYDLYRHNFSMQLPWEMPFQIL